MPEAPKKKRIATDEGPREDPRGPDRQTKVIQPKGERGGRKGPEPTRFGDWEKGGRCFDF